MFVFSCKDETLQTATGSTVSPMSADTSKGTITTEHGKTIKKKKKKKKNLHISKTRLMSLTSKMNILDESDVGNIDFEKHFFFLDLTFYSFLISLASKVFY